MYRFSLKKLLSNMSTGLAIVFLCMCVFVYADIVSNNLHKGAETRWTGLTKTVVEIAKEVEKNV